jgi:acyl-coenzyme A synthetase/AMP-(fatty) acid ligase
MKRAVLNVKNPWDYINDLTDYSIMIINPDSTEARINYLLEKSDYSLLITNSGSTARNGGDYKNEKVFWYTSGTTGDSKFCSFTQEQLNQQAHTICKTYNINQNDRYVSVMPLWHAHGQGMYWATQLAKCETHFISINNIKHMPKHDPTFITAIPDYLKIIGQFEFKNLRFVRSASSPLSKELYQNLKNKFSVPIIEAFGTTEALSHCFTNPLYGEQRMGTIGLPDGIEADIVEGQLYIKGFCVFTPGWYNTGDLADRDEYGYYRILGRYRDQINIRGIKVNPASLETQLQATILNIGNCVIFGNDRVKCLYTGSCDPADIYNFLTGLGKHCRPIMIERVKDIPISPSGKISRTWLNQKY